MRPNSSSVYGVIAGATVSALSFMIYWYGSMHGYNTFVQQSITFPTTYNTGRPTIGDGSNTWGGTPPATTMEPPEIPSNFNTSSMIAATGESVVVGSEAKFRTLCDFAFNRMIDPILYPGQHGVGHMHTFMGNTAVTADSNYNSLRTTGESTCMGGKLNRSAYWYPSVMKDNATGDGRTKIKIPDYAVVYYVQAPNDVDRTVRIPRGLGYVFGFNPSDPTDTYYNDPLSGAACSTAKFCAYASASNGFASWACASGSGGTALYLRDSSGNATINCAAGDQLVATLNGPVCWDGVNLMSPNGRKHMYYGVRHLHSLYDPPICPNGWYQIPRFEFRILFSHQGPNDYKEWYLSSDRMMGSQYEYTAGDCHASNITNGITGSYCNGQTMHTDWFGAWDYDIMETWMTNCNGIDGNTGVSSNHECNDSAIGDGRRMGAPTGFSSAALSEAASWADLPEQP